MTLLPPPDLRIARKKQNYCTSSYERDVALDFIGAAGKQYVEPHGSHPMLWDLNVAAGLCLSDISTYTCPHGGLGCFYSILGRPTIWSQQFHGAELLGLTPK